MNTFKNIPELKSELLKKRLSHKSIALVPTMGALHNGHIELVKKAQLKADIVAVSIFVNPAQFNNPEDLKKYPREVNRDLELLEKNGCDIVFTPEVSEIYPFKHDLSINFGPLENELEGKFRPNHFAGVGLVVSKLFNIFQPDYAFFGQKDLQQFYVIKKLIQQLSFPVELFMVKTLREANGLAMSSRNERLKPEDKKEAALIFSTLEKAKANLLSGATVESVKNDAHELFQKNERLSLEYFEIVETDNFSQLEEVVNPGKTAICLAAEIGGIRLIDNLLLID